MIYLDHNSTTPVDERVFDIMKPFFTANFGNPSSQHFAGWQAKFALKEARMAIAQHLNCHHEEEIVFTSGATESINLALRGYWEQYGKAGQTIVASPTEHKAAIDTLSALEKHGANIEWLKVDANGLIDVSHLDEWLRKGALMVCVMSANNETGVIQPIDLIGELCRKHDAIFMCDITQSLGKYSIDVQQSKIDLACASVHKCKGPKGVGFLTVNRKKPRINLSAQISGGGHENGFRSGTSNVPLIIGMQKAIELAYNELIQTKEHVSLLKKRLSDQLFQSGFFQSTIQANTEQLFNTLHVKSTFSAKYLIGQLASKLCFSSGSACSSALPEPSHVLKAMGMSDDEAWHCIRLSIGKSNKLEEIDKAADLLIATAKKQSQ